MLPPDCEPLYEVEATMMLLTDEERDGIANAIDESSYKISVDYFDAIIDAELKAQLKKVVGELKSEDTRMYTGTLDNPDLLIIKVHKDFWQSLLKETE